MASSRRSFLFHGLIGNFGFGEFRQQRQRFLPAEIASLRRNCCGYPFLCNLQLSSIEQLLQGNRRLHFAGQVRIVEFVGVTEALAGRQFEIGSAEGWLVPVVKLVNDIL